MSQCPTSRLPVIILTAMAAGCGQTIDVGSDLLWTADFEAGNLDEWTAIEGGGRTVGPSSSALGVSSEQAHGGSFAAKMTITTSLDRALSTLDRNGSLPEEAYYSAWFYLPQAASVSNEPFRQYWSIMRFRARTIATDPSTMRPTYDIDLESLPSGQMALRVFDVGLSQDVPLLESDPLVPVGRWLHVEALYRNAPDATGRLSLWLDGLLVADIAKATGAYGWAGWSVANVGVDLTPQTVSVFVDDCAISRVRVGPTGLLK